MEFCQKPFVDIGYPPDFIHAIASMECSRNREYTFVGWVDKFLIDILHEVVLEASQNVNNLSIQTIGTDLGESSKLIIDRPDCLLNRLLESPTDAHNFANTFHTATEKSANAIEFFQIPSWDLHNDIIQAGFETSTSDFGDGVFDLVQGNA